MQISKEKVAAIHYTLCDNDGNILDSSEGRDPLFYIHGIGNLIQGMEESLEGKTKGDKLDIKIAPDKAYGEINLQLIQQVPIKAFGGQEVKEGMRFKTDHGTVVRVTEIGAENITVDANHPLAGVELNFKVEVMEVRNATNDELQHGHVHGPGGHDH